MSRLEPCLIADAELAEYLKDKLLIKPDYDASVGPTEIASDYASVKARMDEMRRQDNDKTKRQYGLKGRK